METLSKPGCIHISQATAKKLVARGRESWLKQREDKVIAKGKGELTTYWVNIPRGGTKSVVSTTTSELWCSRSSSLDCTPQAEEAAPRTEASSDGYENELEV